MNANQIINMIVRLVMRKVLNRGIDAGISKISGRGKPQNEMSREERQQAKAGKTAMKRSNQAMKIARRVGRL